MFSSLRFRLPALFLLGIVVSGLIAAVGGAAAFPGLRPQPVEGRSQA